MRHLFVGLLVGAAVGVSVLAIVTPYPPDGCSTQGKVVNRWIVSGLPPEPSQYIVQVAYGKCIKVEYVQQWQYDQALIGGEFHG